MKKIIFSLSALAAAFSLSACISTDPNAVLDPEVMEDPWMDAARKDTTPSGVMGNALDY